MFDQGHRNSAARSGFVQTPAGTRMRFRLVKVYPIETVPAERTSFGNAFDCAPMDVQIVDYSCPGKAPPPIGGIVRWDPAADKIDGLIKLADLVAQRSGGNPLAICDHDVDVDVIEERKGAKRWNTYTFRLADGSTAVTPAGTPIVAPPQPAYTPPVVTPPAAVAPPPPVPSVPVGTPPVPPPMPQPGPANALRAATDALVATHTLASLSAVLAAHWPAVTAARCTAEVLEVHAQHRRRLVQMRLLGALDGADLTAAWTECATACAEDPTGMELATAAYHRRNAGIANGQPPEGDIPF